MSEHDIRALEALFEGWRSERTPDLDLSLSFERFVAEQVTKDFDLSDEEVSSGIVGGQDDGGIDGFYLFINRTLIQDETPIPQQATTVELSLIQAKYGLGFAEGAIQKIESFSRDLLDYSRPPEDFAYLNSIARDAISRFRDTYGEVLSHPHTLRVVFHYATRSDEGPNPKVLARVENLKSSISEQLSAAKVDFEFWGCSKLLQAARSIPQTNITLETVKSFSTSDASTVCLVRLTDFYKFLIDESSQIRTSIRQ